MDSLLSSTMNTADAAKYLGIGETSFRKHKANRTGPRYLTLGPNGGLVRYRKEDLDEWFASRMMGETNGKMKIIKG